MIGRWMAAACVMLIAGCSAPTPNLVGEPSCKIALRYMQDFKMQAGRPLGVSNEHLGPTKQEIDDFLGSRPNVSATDAEQLRSGVAVRDVDVADHCPEITQWFGQAGITQDAARIEAMTKREPWPIAVLAISVPVLSPSGDTATFYT